ncbi:MAG: monovalent cation/H(+) antiporter subunit G [Chromatiales bacterium]|nr:monovalent cation/H(+) antiporter subunit G [Chromatiales bacterium]
MTWIADVLLLIGAAFLFLGALGLWRMPDVYTRLQAGTKAVTLGSVAMLIGVGIERPDWWPKLLLITLFILLTSPLGSSTVARAARVIGQRPWRAGDAKETP